LQVRHCVDDEEALLEPLPGAKLPADWAAKEF
jgi:hypothetical protein